MFQYVNITHSDTDPGLDPADISTTTPAPAFIPNNDSHAQQQTQHTQVAYNVQPLDLPLVNSDSNPQSSKLDSQPIHPVNGIFPPADSHNLPSHRSIDHVINQPQNPLNHHTLSPPHQDPHLPPAQEADPHLPSHFHRSSDKPPSHVHSMSLPLPLPPPHRPPQHSVPHSQSQCTQSWAMNLPLAPVPSAQPANPISRIRPQLPSDHVYYSPNPIPNPPSSHIQPSAPVNGDNFRHGNVRPYRATTSVHREVDQHQHRSPRKRQKRSLVWNHFKESETDPNVAYCLICKQGIPRGRNLARNTTNLRKHLEHRHPQSVLNPNIPQQSKRGPAPHIMVVPSPAPPPSLIRQDIDDVSGGIRNRNSFLFQQNPPPPHRSSGDDRILGIQSQQAPQIPISQDRSALSLSPAAVYHGATHDGKADTQFRQAQSLEESSSLMPPPGIKRCNSSSNPLHMNQIPVSNLYNSQPQGSTQLHVQPDLTESGPNARSKEPPSWDPKSLRPPKRFFPEGDDGEEANSNGDRQPATQEACAALIKFLAAAGLPLSMAKSRSLLDLLDVTNNRPHFPNAVELRDHVLPNQVTLLHSKIRRALSSADMIVATIEKRDKNRLLVCHYFAQNFTLRSVCLDVIHPAEVKEGFIFGGKASSTENSACLQSRSEQMTAENSKRIRKLLQRVSNNFDYWKITHKVNAVIVAEKGITADNSHFLPEPSNSGNLPALAFREPDTSSKSSRRPPYGSDHGQVPAYDQATDTGSSVQNRIPVLSCLISTIERIITETICQSDLIARCFIEPLSRGMFKALTDREFLLSEASQAWSSDLKLPVCNPSPWELRSLFSFFSLHMETVQHAVKRVDPKDLAFLCMIKKDITFLHSLLETFASSVRDIEPTEVQGRTSKRERTSTALPVMRNLLKSLEDLHEQVGDSLRVVTTDVVRAVRFQANRMEKQDLYACATLLDPRFKSQYLSKDVLDDLKNNVKDACANESRRRDARSGKTSESMSNEGGNQSNALEHYMESIIPGKSVSSSALSSYLTEPPAGFNDDIDDYWNRNQGRWPILARVAARYTVIPCSCGSEGISKVLLGSLRRNDNELDLSGKEIQAMSAMELLRMNSV